MEARSIAPHLTWLVPLVSAIISGMIVGVIEIHDLIVRVDKVETIQQTTAAKYIKKVDDIDFRMRHIEDFCCSELKEYDYYLEKKVEHGLESSTKH